MELTLRECTAEDLGILYEKSNATFNDAFGPMNNPADMKAYTEQAFNIVKLRKELSNNHSRFYFIYSGAVLSGYIKLNEFGAQTDINDPESLEIERIYIVRSFQGKGMGQLLMDRAIDIARAGGKKYVWLGVWEKNEEAIRFYKRNGFRVTGKHSFFLGDDEQTDYIMSKEL